jgi:glycosyltransferase involved in cell wall biosynthesis
MGLTKSLNKAIKLSKGKYIARMDSDDISHKDRLLKQINFLNKNRDYALVGANVIKIDKNDNIIEKNITKYTDEDIKQTFKIRNCIAHGSVMINKDLLKSDLYYDEEFKYAQDFKLWCKIAKNYKVINLEEYLYNLRIHDKSISKQKIEQQSIFAGVVAYEFQNNCIIDIQNDLKANDKLRFKIGIVLLTNFEPTLAIKYFSKFSIYYYVSVAMQYMDLKNFKRFLK